MEIKIALAGNPNSGKTTLFNALTGSNQFVGNWPGVTVEKKEGKLKGHKDVIITDLPGIYSLSPYTLEEVVARNYLIGERPNAILNIIDGTNLERNLYLTTQLVELGIPVVCAINMMDIVRKNGDTINIEQLSKELGCKVVEISALKGTGVTEAAEAAIAAAEAKEPMIPQHKFCGCVEHAIAHIEEAVLHDVPEQNQRWYAIKVFERDEKVLEMLKIDSETLAHITQDIEAAEKEMDDDAESIITNERYIYIGTIIKECDGWHLLGIGTSAYEEAAEEYGDAPAIIEAFIEKAQENGIDTAAVEEAIDSESETFDVDTAKTELDALAANFTDADTVTYTVEDEETLATEDVEATGADLADAVDAFVKYDCADPDPAAYGVWVPGVPVLIGNLLESVNCAEWLSGLILDGIVAGVGAVLGFVPQMLVLFLLLAFLEACGYMARIAFVMDRIFRKFGLSGKSFIPMLVGVGCGVPGIMASRTIENERDRRMTVMTTTFIPCGAKVPFIAMIAGAIFGGSPIVATSAYFIGAAAIIVSGIMLKKTKMFAGDPAPFVMELPAYHLPTVGNLLRSMWERGWSFIKKAGTVILLSTIFVWFTTYFGVVDGTFRMLSEEEIDSSILAAIGGVLAWIFKPLGWGNWQATVASITGLVAKENIVGTMGILYGGGEGSVYDAIGAAFTGVTGYSFLVFNLLCAPCFAAMGAIKREMNNGKWTAFAIGYQCGFAYVVALCINQFGNLFTGNVNVIGLIVALLCLAGIIYMLVKPYKESNKLTANVKVKS